ncbi:MAG: preprotein translocase subunit SecE [Candidatus Shapirobacteria bacterium]|nr:preprotein translocase subunit SecE [Candidatus Shapirobacteria bacterium]
MALPTTFKSIPAFFKEVKSELTKVTWLSRQQTIRLTSIVIGVSLVVAAFISSLDFLFTKMMEIFIK